LKLVVNFYVKDKPGLFDVYHDLFEVLKVTDDQVY
jgi:hypothetical protein